MQNAHEHPHQAPQRPGYRRQRRDEFGFGPFGPGFGPGRGPRGGRRRMRRGDVRAALLVLLAEESRNGYQLMQEIEQRSDGNWRPSPGSVYPALSQLEDEGLIATEETGKRKLFALTDEGKKFVKENAEKLCEPWANLGDDPKGPHADLTKEVKPLMGAVGQVYQAGSEADVKAATEVLGDARRKIYSILAGEKPKKG